MRCFAALMTVLITMAAGPQGAVAGEFGLKAGYGHSNLVANPLQMGSYQDVDLGELSGQWQGSFWGGLYCVAPLSETFALQLEALYGTKGYGQDLPDGQYSREEVRLKSLDFPLLTRWEPSGRGAFCLAGVTLGIPLSQKVTLTDDGIDVTVDLDALDRADVCLLAGAGLAVDWGDVEIRYAYGIRNLDQPGVYRVRTRTWTVMTGVLF